jgi:CRP/FNR family transcriptional regulator, cyclic AMP receptor protein
MYESQLATVPLFQDLSWRERSWIGDACRERLYVAGDEVTRQNNSSGVGLFIVMQGHLRLSRAKGGTTPSETSEAGVGAVIGEQALLEDAPSELTITATEPTRLLVLPIWDFRMTLRDFPDLAIHLLAILGQRLHQAMAG